MEVELLGEDGHAFPLESALTGFCFFLLLPLPFLSKGGRKRFEVGGRGETKILGVFVLDVDAEDGAVEGAGEVCADTSDWVSLPLSDAAFAIGGKTRPKLYNSGFHAIMLVVAASSVSRPWFDNKPGEKAVGSSSLTLGGGEGAVRGLDIGSTEELLAGVTPRIQAVSLSVNALGSIDSPSADDVGAGRGGCKACDL